jgi:acetyl-CoA carboxylase biotin carboxyl carrier protein
MPSGLSGFDGAASMQSQRRGCPGRRRGCPGRRGGPPGGSRLLLLSCRGGPGRGGGAVELTNEDVADILALLDSLPYDELDLSTSRFRLTLRRAADGGWTESRQVTSEPDVLGPPAGDGPAPQAGPATADGGTRPAAGTPGGPAAGHGGASSGDAAREDAGARLADVAAPLPGTFYRAPRPGAAPFVEVGSQVSAGTVVAIVETMKLMNSVHAGTAGRVAQILIGNGEPVTQGAALMRIEPGQ